jgi:hypothetical protein
MPNTKLLRICIFLVTLLQLQSFIGANTIYAQENQLFEGEFAANQYVGDARYEYSIIDNDTILNGFFDFKKANLDALLKKQDYTFHISGEFKKNRPNGYWKFQFGTFESNNESQVIDYQYRVAVNGLQEEAYGEIVNGKPNGKWVYSANEITDSKISSTLFKSTIDFNEGIPRQNFKIENDSITLVGRFLRNGLAHDEWSLFAPSGLGAAENWTFNNGLLEKIEIENNGNSTTINVFQKQPKKTKQINLDSKYVKTVALMLSLNKKSLDDFGGGMQKLLSKNADYYQKIDSILSALGEFSFLPEFKVTVPYYPITEKENTEIDTIQSLFSIAQNISNSILDNTQLNIIKRSDREAAYYYEVVEEIKANFLNPTEELLNYTESGIIEFTPRHRLINLLWKNNKPETLIAVNIPTDSIVKYNNYELEDAKDYDFSKSNLEAVFQIIRYASKSLEQINEKLNNKLTKEQRQNELIELEKKLILQREKLESIIDSATIKSSRSSINALSDVIRIADKKLSSYTTVKDYKLKLESGNKIKKCNENLIQLAMSLAILPDQEETIKEKYKDRIWNPFMATLMDEEVKKRITTAYRKVVVPHFIKSVNQDLKCEKVEELNLLMKNSYQRMLELRVENTSKLERKLRRTNNPQVVLELFGLITNPKAQ